ncbi:MAG: hypothetical protein M4579_002772 [Chaenotheca gracillima]|nr:MAG: hypothetical protein M4579_002772 [Chaenotheca gracillima]
MQSGLCLLQAALFLAASPYLVLAAPAAGSAPSATATIDSGVVVGTTTSVPSATVSVNKFLGIPFAASPPERFSPPAKPASWSSPLDVSAFKPACIQQFNDPESTREFQETVFNSPPPQESEDCLYLNVFVPASPAPSGGRAVFFWIFGGGLEFGNAGQPFYDGSSFAANQDIIVVTTNYRTNVFGFPSSPELPLTGQNLGFLDQRFALQWVQNNIAEFGGDPKKVTIGGQSAGAESVDALVTGFAKNAPFRGAILQSGQISVFPLEPGNGSLPAWETLVKSLGCEGQPSELACVRAAPASTVRTTIETDELIFYPVTDEVTFVSNPALRRSVRDIATVPLLLGSLSQEGRAFTYGMDNLEEFVSMEIPSGKIVAAALNLAYPIGSPGISNANDQIGQIFTELVFQCPAADLSHESAAAGIPTWRYYYNATFPNIQPYPGLGDFHSSEIPIVFGTYPTEGATAQEVGLSKFMQTAWATFVKNPASGPGWSRVGLLPGKDLANIGSNGATGETIISELPLDKRCAIFDPLYLLEGLLPTLKERAMGRLRV